MKDLKLTINLLPKGAWNNDLSKTLSQKDWDILRKTCYDKANNKCQICGYSTSDLDAHEEWGFDCIKQTQTLKNIIALCTKCHMVKHFKNTLRLGQTDNAKLHFLNVNQCSEMDFASHLSEALLNYENNNKVLRWKQIVNLEKFGGNGIKFKETIIPLIKSPYESIDFMKLHFSDMEQLFNIQRYPLCDLWGVPKVLSLTVDNYQGIIKIKSMHADRIEWFLDDVKIKTKYNWFGLFTTKFSVKNLTGHNLKFKLCSKNGEMLSKEFILYNPNTNV